MGGKHSLLSSEDLDDYQALTFFNRKEILAVLHRFCQLLSIDPHGKQIRILNQRLSKRNAMNMQELRFNPFRERIVEVFSSHADGSLSFEDFLDMMSVFSKNAPKSVKVSYAFKIYQGIYQGARSPHAPRTANAIDIYDVREIIRRLSCSGFDEKTLTKIAEAVIKEVDLRDDKCINAEIFEYFLSNIPDFVPSFIIPVSDGKNDQKLQKQQVNEDDVEGEALDDTFF